MFPGALLIKIYALMSLSLPSRGNYPTQIFVISGNLETLRTHGAWGFKRNTQPDERHNCHPSKSTSFRRNKKYFTEFLSFSGNAAKPTPKTLIPAQQLHQIPRGRKALKTEDHKLPQERILPWLCTMSKGRRKYARPKDDPGAIRMSVRPAPIQDHQVLYPVSVLRGLFTPQKGPRSRPH